MKTTANIGPVLTKARVRKECEHGRQEVRHAPQTEMDLSEIAAQRQKVREQRAAELDTVCSSLFKRAIEAWGKAENYADEIGVTKSILSDMCSGKRVIKLRDCWPLFDSVDSSLVFLAGLAEQTDDIAPPRRKVKAKRADVEASVTQRVRAIVELWQLIRPAVAAQLGTDADDVDAALDRESLNGV